MRTLLISIVFIAGCGSSDNKTVDAAPSIDAAIDAPPVTLDCTSYCSAITTNCTGANAQYPDMGHCMGACAGFPVGLASDTSGATLGCHLYHGGTPSATTPTTHCIHAGPSGGAVNAAGVCGDACVNFCNIEIKTCGSIDAPIAGGVITPQYQNSADCMTKCGAFPNKDQNYSTTAKGDSLACRLYHVTNAAAASVAVPAVPAMVNAHCGHSGPNGGANQLTCMAGTLP